VGLPELRPSLRSEIRQRWLESAARMFGGKSLGDGVDATKQRLEGFLVKIRLGPNAQKREWRRGEQMGVYKGRWNWRCEDENEEIRRERV
jgi:hypothetical protein